MATTQDYLKILDNAIKDAHPAGQIKLGATVVPATFCTTYATIKPIVMTFLALASWIPVYGATIQAWAGGMMQIADDIYNAECTVTAAPPAPGVSRL